jgi:integrase
MKHILACVPKVERKTTYSASESRKNLERIQKATPDLQRKLRALVLLLRYGGLAIIDGACFERTQLVVGKGTYRVRLKSRQKTSKREVLQAIDNAIPPFLGKELEAVMDANENPRYAFWNRGDREGASDDAEKREAVKYWQKWIRALLDTAGLPNATSHMFRHTLAIEMIRNGATFEDVAAALGNTVAVVAKFYSHEWAKVRQGRTDKAIKATW